MTFSFAEYLEYVTRDTTFNPGDMIAAGTCKGTAMDSTPRLESRGFSNDKLFLRVGDAVEVSLEGFSSSRSGFGESSTCICVSVKWIGPVYGTESRCPNISSP
jgi:2-keto-4-pentenoate hydratase/2-oxohepta-3-ene-1,7-dioic acid hydratase in catechol pathway